MNPIAISISRVVSGQDELDVVDTLFVEPTAPEDWQLAPDELRRKNEELWRSVKLPHGETIQLRVAISTVNDGFSMAVRQTEKELTQLLCEGKPFFTFRTVGGALLAIQVFDRKQFESAQEEWQ